MTGHVWWTLKRSVVLLAIALSALAVVLCVPASAQRFFDKADSLGLYAAPNSHYLGSGVSVYDFNQDGWDDITIPMPFDTSLFYVNMEGSFVLAPGFVNDYGESKHLLWVDYDNDADLDIAFSTYEGQYRLLNNDGNFNFTDVTEEAGLTPGVERYYGMCFADYDRDGDLDFYATCYTPASYEPTFNRLNHLYRNNGDGTFTNVTYEAGVGDGWKLSFQAAWFDYDMDGWQDLFVINDHNFENSLYRNNGDGTFSDVSEEAGVQFGGHNPMTITVGDFDNDGDLDIYTTNTFAFLKRAMLLVNNGDGTFSDQAEQFGVDAFAWTWGAIWFDMDNDADQDLFVAAGHISPNVLTNENFLYENFEGQFFEDATLSELFGQDNRKSYGVGRGDFNNDGYCDIAVANREPHNMNLWLNEGGANHYVKITLEGTLSNKMAIGSWIRVFVNGQQSTQYTLCGENYIGQNSQHHVFGLNSAELVDSIEVEYVSGHIDKYYAMPVDTHYFFTEGETFSPEISTIGALSFCEQGEVILDAGNYNGYLWNTGHEGQFLTVTEPGNYWVTVETNAGWTGSSDTLTIQVSPEPVIEVEVGQPLCHGESTGWLHAENLVGVPLFSVEWSNGFTGAQIEGIEAGTYTYEATDINGCEASGAVFVLEPMPLSVQAYSFLPVEGNDGMISVVINGGTPPYTIMLNGEQVPQIIDSLEAGLYQLLVHDTNLCSFSEVVNLGFPTGLEQKTSELRLFPNPVEAFLLLESYSPIRSAVILAADGRQVMTVSGQSLVEIDVSNLAAGVYELKVQVAGNLESGGRFVKK